MNTLKSQVSRPVTNRRPNVRVGRTVACGNDTTNLSESQLPVASFGPYVAGSSSIEVHVCEKLAETERGQQVQHFVVIHRKYQDGRKCKESLCLCVADIPYVIVGLEKAFEFIANAKSS